MIAPAITIKNITKQFSIYHKPHEALVDLIPYFSSKIQKHIALDNISFEVYKGEFLGIIGQNGSGKSTLLKILCGVLHQTSGEIDINGKILSLLELGTGFNPDLTGRENLFVSASLMGFDTRLIAERLSEIEVFADIGEYFDVPVKTYSSGMYVRLAMSMFLHLEPEIFIIDEALSVGDIFFQQKCFAKIDEMRKRGVTFILVSHDLGLIQKVCDRVAYLEHGHLKYIGDRTVACKLYYEPKQLNAAHTEYDLETPILLNLFSEGVNLLQNQLPSISSPKAKIYGLRITNELGEDTSSVQTMESLYFHFFLYIDPSLEFPGLNILIKNQTGLLISNITNPIESYGTFEMIVKINFPIQSEKYSFDITIGNRTDKNANIGKKLTAYDNAGILDVLFDYQNKKALFYGLIYIPSEVFIGAQI